MDPFDFCLTWNLLTYLHVQINSDMGGFKSSFLQIFFLLLSVLSFWFSYNAHVGELMVSHKSLELCALHFSAQTGLFQFFYIQVYFSSASSNILNPFSVFFHVIVLFSSRISMWFLFIISLLIFSFCSYIIFLVFFTAWAYLRQLV